MGSAVYSPGITTSVDDDDVRETSLAPNPATDVVQLPTDAVDVRITDMSGVSVLSASLAAGSPFLSVSTLPSGTYSVLLRLTDGSIRHESLVIVR
ncbi:MAG: T9SS type A sorting domain-containing protein, partial [Candidatus Kapaibacterium sp.]